MKRIHGVIILLPLFLVGAGKCFGQNLTLPTVIPPSPEATALFKHTETPVSYYAGLPQISVPLHTIDVKGLSIPIVMSYHARGIQVEEIPSRVGLGWSLSFGGMISRQTRDMEDDGKTNGHNGYLSDNIYSSFFSNEATRMAVEGDVINGQIDLYPDMFYFDANGLSGKFIIDQADKLVILQKFDDIKIEYLPQNAGNPATSSKILGWIVTDKFGNKFYYGQSKDGSRNARNSEETLMRTRYSTGLGLEVLASTANPRTTAWCLMEIETYFGEKIEFFYGSLPERSEYFRREYDAVECQAMGSYACDGPKVAVTYFSKMKSNQFQLHEIVYNGGNVVFTKSTLQRQDLELAYELNKVEIFDPSNQLINSYEFVYQYVTSPPDDNHWEYLETQDPKSNKRMFLKEIKKSGDSTYLPFYGFDYSNILLPNRFSNSQDAWGYYNGANNGSFLTLPLWAGTFTDRTVDTVKSEAGLLKKVLLPTGGEIRLEFEHNKVRPPSFWENLWLVSGINPLPDDSTRIHLVDGFIKGPDYYTTSGTNGYYSKVITIGHQKLGFVKSVIQFSGEYASGCSETMNLTTCHYTVQLLGLDNNKSYSLYKGINNHNTIAPGTYLLKVTPTRNHIPGGGSEDPNDFENGFVVTLSWDEQVADPNELIYAAGKRIKRIEYYDGSNSYYRNYEYKDNTGKSSGKLLSLPAFHYIQRWIHVNGSIETYPVIDQYGSRPGSPLTSLQGNNVGYSRVIEYYGDAENNHGKIEYEFTTPDDEGDYYKLPYHPPTDNEWLRGKLISSKYYEYNSGNYVLKKSIDNDWIAGTRSVLPPDEHEFPVYEKDREKAYIPMIIFRMYQEGESRVDWENNPHNYFKTFFFRAGTLDLVETKETTYGESGHELTISKTNNYDHDTHYQVASQSVTGSDGNKTITNYYYPPNILAITSLGSPDLSASELDAIQQLHELHNIGSPVQTETIVEDNAENQLSRIVERTSYFESPGTGLVLPEIVKTLRGVHTTSNPMEDRIVHHKYDGKGNILDVSKANGTRISYIWGYNGQYPVAIIENKKYIDIPSSIISAIHSATTDAQLTIALNNLRNSSTMEDAMVTTYTYKPLVGMATKTDPAGKTTYFEYDDLNRLDRVLDNEGNLVKTYKYHYKKQP